MRVKIGKKLLHILTNWQPSEIEYLIYADLHRVSQDRINSLSLKKEENQDRISSLSLKNKEKQYLKYRFNF